MSRHVSSNPTVDYPDRFSTVSPVKELLGKLTVDLPINSCNLLTHYERLNNISSENC